MIKILIFLIIILIQILITQSFKCGLSKKKKVKIQQIPSSLFSENKTRNLDSSPIKIYVDYEIIEDQLPKEILTNIQEAFNISIKIFQNYLSVKSKGKYKLNKKLINDVEGDFTGEEIPYLLENSDKIEADLFLVPYMDETLDEQTQAAAYPMLSDKKTKRPILGCVDLNPELDFKLKNSIKFLSMLLLHEISHILAFNDQLFPLFMNIKKPIKTLLINGINRTLLQTPKVLEYARGHFGCPSLTGVELENQGGSGSSGSHWEARIMLGDYMISTDYPELVVSDITLAVFEDSGWYNVNYYTGGLFKTGKGEGCNFLQIPCINSSRISNFPLDFCHDSEDAFCSPGMIDRGQCTIFSYSNNIKKEYQYFGSKKIGGFEPADYCPVSLNDDDIYYKLYSRCDNNGLREFPTELGEKFGNNSFCFISSLLYKNSSENMKKKYSEKRTMCYEVKECNDEYLYYLVDIGDNLFNCSNAIEMNEYNIEGFDGSFICPPYWRICGGSVLCNDPIECSELKSITRFTNMSNYVKDKSEFKQ